MYEFLNQLLSNSYGIYILCLVSYLIGSISGSMLLGSFKGIDIRSKGSGNAGATNALRTVGPFFALGVMSIDVLKGFIPVYIAAYCTTEYLELYQVLIASCAVLGHVYPIYYKFKGGKGVATGFGVFIYLMPLAAFSSIAVFVATLGISRYVSIGSMLGALSLPLFGLLFKMPLPYLYSSMTIALFIIFKTSFYNISLNFFFFKFRRYRFNKKFSCYRYN